MLQDLLRNSSTHSVELFLFRINVYRMLRDIDIYDSISFLYFMWTPNVAKKCYKMIMLTVSGKEESLFSNHGVCNCVAIPAHDSRKSKHKSYLFKYSEPPDLPTAILCHSIFPASPAPTKISWFRACKYWLIAAGSGPKSSRVRSGTTLCY